MKKIGAILSLALIAVLLSAPLCFAGSLEIVESYPKDGQSNLQNINCGVKVYFNEEVYSKAGLKANEKCFLLQTEKGKAISSSVLYSSKEPNLVLVLAKDNLEVNSGYKLKISGKLQAANGDTLGKDKIINFRTRDTSKDMLANMVMMGLMMVGMIFFSSKSMKKQMAKEKAERDNKVNPYKVAKETGKSVEDIVAKTEKEKQKKAQAEAKKKAKEKKEGVPRHEETQISKDTKRVSVPRPISAGGSIYKTGRKGKTEAETKAKAGAKGTTNPKNQKGKSKKK